MVRAWETATLWCRFVGGVLQRVLLGLSGPPEWLPEI